MREIKFRAFIKKENKIVDVKSIHCRTKNIMYGYSENEHCYGNRTISFYDVELMQFTGLKDKNGKEIYEGDIISFPDHSSYDYDTYMNIGVIEFEEGGYYLSNRECVDMLDLIYHNVLEESEVIGNIYENKELLESGRYE